jgi:hypothetical protein
MPLRARHTSFMQASETHMITVACPPLQTAQAAPSCIYRIKPGESGTRRSPAPALGVTKSKDSGAISQGYGQTAASNCPAGGTARASGTTPRWLPFLPPNSTTAHGHGKSESQQVRASHEYPGERKTTRIIVYEWISILAGGRPLPLRR